MKKLVLLLIVPFALLLGVRTASAQEKTPAPATTQMKASSHRSTTSNAALWNSFKPETLSGTISLIDPSTKSVYVTGSGGVSYQFVVTPKTKIEIGGTKSSFNDLVSETQKQITVTFVARPKGDFAHSITVSG